MTISTFHRVYCSSLLSRKETLSLAFACYRMALSMSLLPP